MTPIPPIPTYESREIYNPKLGKQVTHGRPFTVVLYSEHLERIAKLTAEVEELKAENLSWDKLCAELHIEIHKLKKALGRKI